MSEHTPLPWTWDEGRPENYDLTWLLGAGGKQILTMYGGPYVHGHAAKPSQADRNLISAAPDLLAACESALTFLECEDRLRWNIVGRPVTDCPLTAMVRAAIVKAEA